MASTLAAKQQSAVTVSLAELEADSVPFSVLEEAFGPSSLGILVVRDVPPEFPALRRKLLSYASYLANLPPEDLEKLEVPEAKWLVGWSCGKETLKSGRYDTLKGSYYVNCAPEFEDQDTQRNIASQYPSFPEYTAPNVWPSEDLLPGFKDTFQELCTLIIEVAVLVARACDKYAQEKIPDYRAGFLEHLVESSVSSKARLLHYFPVNRSPPTSAGINVGAATGAGEEGEDEGYDEDEEEGDFDEEEDAYEELGNEAHAPSEDDDWCATHKDHGCLTGLTSAMFIDESTNRPISQPTPNPPYGHFDPKYDANGHLATLPELTSSPDPEAGLYIHSREGDVVKVNIPRDCLAFQTGEALEVITKGRFKAVPHFVRGPKTVSHGGRVARNTLAVFTQPNLWEKVGDTDFAGFARGVVERNH
ncbi:Clavaminate synthase-like protein [Viridothelium virens]|uniref:Clavaminate synthase-like protein n=1 Tax=Viridothelium virens TaxID=1048519 RepID=A0A6A6HA51_VIRVR|nr:Clavaminate synthase-like protein [Viridothelium virens]